MDLQTRRAFNGIREDISSLARAVKGGFDDMDRRFQEVRRDIRGNTDAISTLVDVLETRKVIAPSEARKVRSAQSAS